MMVLNIAVSFRLHPTMQGVAPAYIGAEPNTIAGFPQIRERAAVCEAEIGRGKYAQGMEATSPSEARLRALLEAGITLTSELSLDAVLQRLVEIAAELTGARYAALGVIDPSGSQLERFLTHGVDAETQQAIGDPPRGRGILGVLIREATPLRLADLTEDPRSVGFPPGHPPMRSFLGVPILLRGVAYGNLYLTEKEGGAQFTEEDQELVTLLAGQAAVAVENARLYESSTRWSRQLESLHEVIRSLAGETDLRTLLTSIAARLRELVEARLVLIALPTPDGDLQIEAADGDGGAALVGHRLARASSKSGRVLERRQSARVDSMLDDPEVDWESEMRPVGARTGLYAPLLVRGRAIGIIALHDKDGRDSRFSDADVRLVEIFAARAAVAVDLSERVARDALRRVVAAQELERRRLARELHDETGQALTSILLGLKPLEDVLHDDTSRAAVGELRELVVATLRDVRRLAVELRPKALDDFGLVAALERLTQNFEEQTRIEVDLQTTLGTRRLPTEVETALYRIAQEALTNVVKHARASHVSLVLQRRPGAISAVIEDDGAGFDPSSLDDQGLGLVGMRERLALLDGRLEIESSPNAGTTLVVEVPLP
jgi:signal transduction histidine kinase